MQINQKEVIKLREETSEEQFKKYNESKSQFFEKITKLLNLARMTRKKEKEDTQKLKLEIKIGILLPIIKKIIRKYYE